MTSSVVADENVSVVIDAVLPMYDGLALEVSSRMSSTFLEKNRAKSSALC